MSEEVARMAPGLLKALAPEEAEDDYYQKEETGGRSRSAKQVKIG